MNDLQIALLAAGAAFVAAVWGYNKWQERQHRALAEKIFRGEQPDVLLDKKAPVDVETNRGAFSIEPTVDRLAPAERVEPTERAAPAEFEYREPVVAPAPVVAQMPEIAPAPAPVPAAEPLNTGAAQPQPQSLPPLPEALADDIADCLVRLDFVEPVSSPGIWASQSRWAGNIGKTMSWLGFDTTSRQWQVLTAHDGGYCQVVIGALQMADRRGAATDAELSLFLDGAREMAARSNGVADLPGHDDMLMHARGLDEFCAGVDLQLGVNIVAPPSLPFAGTKLRGLAEAAGLVLRNDGCFHALDPAGQTRFTLGNIGTERFEAESMKSLATHGVTLSLDVPRVADGSAVFDAMLVVAWQLTQGLDGSLVDGQGHPLSGEMIAAIRAKVGELQQKMAIHQIVPGSVRALRLFS